MICAASFLGVGALDGTSTPVNGSTAAWDAGAITVADGSLSVGAAYTTVTDRTSTPTSPSVELFDFTAGVGSLALTVCYRIDATGGSKNVTGTWDFAQLWLALAAAYKTGAPVTPDLLMPTSGEPGPGLYGPGAEDRGLDRF